MKLILRQAPSFDIKDCSDADEIVSLTMAYMNTLFVYTQIRYLHFYFKVHV
jgi:hypothetical protein